MLSYMEYVSKWQPRMKEAYEIASMAAQKVKLQEVNSITTVGSMELNITQGTESCSTTSKSEEAQASFGHDGRTQWM